MECRIGQVRAGALAPRGTARRKHGAPFDPWLAETPAAAAVQPPTPSLALPMLDLPDDAAAQQHGFQALDALRQWQLALLDGRDAGPAAVLQQPWPAAADPALQAVLHEIRLRAAVEQARRERDGAAE